MGKTAPTSSSHSKRFHEQENYGAFFSSPLTDNFTPLQMEKTKKYIQLSGVINNSIVKIKVTRTSSDKIALLISMVQLMEKYLSILQQSGEISLDKEINKVEVVDDINIEDFLDELNKLAFLEMLQDGMSDMKLTEKNRNETYSSNSESSETDNDYLSLSKSTKNSDDSNPDSSSNSDDDVYGSTDEDNSDYDGSEPEVSSLPEEASPNHYFTRM